MTLAEGASANRRELKNKEILFCEGQPWDGLYRVQEGAIEIYREREGKIVLLNIEGPGALIGTATLLSRRPRLASARARGEAVVLHLERSPAEQLLKSMPDWGKAIIKDLLNHLDSTDEHLVDASLRAGDAPPPDTLPVVAVQKFLEGLCWTQGYRKASHAGGEIEVVPIGDIGRWLGPVMRLPPDKIRAALHALESSGMIRLVEIDGLGVCVKRHG